MQGHALMLDTLNVVKNWIVQVVFHSTASVTSSVIPLATVAMTST